VTITAPPRLCSQEVTQESHFSTHGLHPQQCLQVACCRPQQACIRRHVLTSNTPSPNVLACARRAELS
jgi:hypothetical protein